MLEPAQSSVISEPALDRSKVTLHYIDEEVVRTSHCEATARVMREIEAPSLDVEDVIRVLLAGPTDEERARGVQSPFESTPSDPEAKPLRSYFLSAEPQGDVVRLRFRGEAMAYLNAAACVQTSVKTSIERTLRAWGGYREVVYVVDGVVVDEWDA